MKNLFKLVVTTLLVFNFLNNVDGQKFEYQTVFLTTQIKKSDGNWSEWSEPELQHYYVLIDFEKNRAIIDSPEIQVFDFTSRVEGREYAQGGVSFNWKAVKEGKPCNVQFYDGENFDDGMPNKALLIYYDQITYKYQLMPNDL